MTNLPLSFVEIPDFAYFIFSFILFWKNIHVLLLYPKHVIKLSGYNLGCYKTSPSQMMKTPMRCKWIVGLKDS